MKCVWLVACLNYGRHASGSRGARRELFSLLFTPECHKLKSDGNNAADVFICLNCIATRIFRFSLFRESQQLLLSAAFRLSCVILIMNESHWLVVLLLFPSFGSVGLQLFFRAHSAHCRLSSRVIISTTTHKEGKSAAH